jgi:hypothetical protein
VPVPNSRKKMCQKTTPSYEKLQVVVFIFIPVSMVAPVVQIAQVIIESNRLAERLNYHTITL